MEVEYRKFTVTNPVIAKCPECRNFGERIIRNKGNNKYLYYYHRNGNLKTCYIGKIE